MSLLCLSGSLYRILLYSNMGQQYSMILAHKFTVQLVSKRGIDKGMG
jgi:hypothetical protein